ncbi:MAG: thymidine phosphorylase [Chloroflexota bacterium]|nr:MAG: thymidine phosphorylase [Chloroflexota bacterium]
MTALDLIREKRDGQAHSDAGIQFLVKGATDGTIPDYQLAAWLMAVRLRGMTDAETTALTLAMAASGRQLDLSSIPGRKVDKHSTGGVGDKATLVVAPLVAAAGVPVAKLSGRALGHSGGTLDKLEAIAGFQVDLPVDRFIAQVRRIGIAIAGQTSDMVPADRALYALRDATATVDSVPLIASSVMSKKLAAGADAILLDVKCGRGAFIANVSEAEALAHALVRIGSNAGRQTVAYITDKMLRLAGHPPVELRRLLTDGSALRKLAELITAQDGDPQVVDDPRLLPAAPVQQPVTAPAHGYIARADALEIALAGKALGAGRDRKDATIDLAVGVVLEKKIGDAVKAGEILAVIHARSAEAARNVTDRVAAAFTIARQAQPRALLLRRVTASGVERLDA